jgi:TRAP-type C4-dicarboxylate transport system permease small subunit
VEQQFGHEKFLGIHSSVLAGIIPVGLILIGFRFLVQLIITFTREEQAA